MVHTRYVRFMEHEHVSGHQYRMKGPTINVRTNRCKGKKLYISSSACVHEQFSHAGDRNCHMGNILILVAAWTWLKIMLSSFNRTRT